MIVKLLVNTVRRGTPTSPVLPMREENVTWNSLK